MNSDQAYHRADTRAVPFLTAAIFGAASMASIMHAAMSGQVAWWLSGLGGFLAAMLSIGALYWQRGRPYVRLREDVIEAHVVPLRPARRVPLVAISGLEHCPRGRLRITADAYPPLTLRMSLFQSGEFEKFVAALETRCQAVSSALR